jgi:hypothetical protein
MSDTDRILGRIEEFMDQTRDQLAANREDHEKILRILDDQQAFRWQVLGGAAAVSALISVAVPLILRAI